MKGKGHEELPNVENPRDYFLLLPSNGLLPVLPCNKLKSREVQNGNQMQLM